MKNIYTNTYATFTTANGETVSYQEIFESVRKSVETYGKAGGRDLSAEELEDLFQDSILKALKYCNRFDPAKAQAKTWANRIALNAQRDAFREHNKHLARFVRPWGNSSEDEELDYSSFFDNLPGGYSADREVEGSEAMDRIENAISSLNENYQFIISLQLEGLKPKKMAELIGCTANAASTLLCRARKALKKVLGSSFLAVYGIAA
ncbi:MAG: sigma-70 family RNA polymerase sigma factor [Bacteroidales bacterium]|nr:sigma-70 family RNA polymerase sigma factor [Bacteroidales bacterium]